MFVFSPMLYLYNAQDAIEGEECNCERYGLYSSVAERQSCKLKVLGSIPSGGFAPPSAHYQIAKCYKIQSMTLARLVPAIFGSKDQRLDFRPEGPCAYFSVGPGSSSCSRRHLHSKHLKSCQQKAPSACPKLPHALASCEQPGCQVDRVASNLVAAVAKFLATWQLSATSYKPTNSKQTGKALHLNCWALAAPWPGRVLGCCIKTERRNATEERNRGTQRRNATEGTKARDGERARW